MAHMIPNTFMIPTLYIDKAQEYLMPSEQVVLFRLVREILGRQQNVEDRTVSLRILTHGKTKIVNGQEVKVMGGCGLSTKAAVRDALGELVRYGFVVETGSVSVKGKEYKLQLDDTKIDWEGLEQRLTDRRHGNRSATLEARQKAIEQNPRRKPKQTANLPTGPQYAGQFEGREALYTNLCRAHGVGDALANALLDYLGPQTHEVLLEGKGALLEAVPGVGAVTAQRLIKSYAGVAHRLGEVEEETSKGDAFVEHARRIYAAYEAKRKELNGAVGLSQWNMGHLVKEVRRTLHRYDPDDVVRCALYLTTTNYYRGKQLAPIHPGSVSYHIEQWVAMERPETESVYRQRNQNRQNEKVVTQNGRDDSASDEAFLRQRQQLRRRREPSVH